MVQCVCGNASVLLLTCRSSGWEILLVQSVNTPLQIFHFWLFPVHFQYWSELERNHLFPVVSCLFLENHRASYCTTIFRPRFLVYTATFPPFVKSAWSTAVPVFSTFQESFPDCIWHHLVQLSSTQRLLPPIIFLQNQFPAIFTFVIFRFLNVFDKNLLTL